MDAGRAILRWTIGPLFIGHGLQKLRGWFGGPGLEGTAGFFESLGLKPGHRHAKAAGAAEAAGGALVTVGFMTPVAASLLSGVMVTAIRKVHAQKGVWNTGGGFEYNAVLMAALAALVEQGPGRPSLDSALMPRVRGPLLAVLSLGAGAAGSFISERLVSERPATAPPAQPAAGPATPQASAGQEAAGAGDGDGDGDGERPADHASSRQRQRSPG